jgi:SAM-dependent methyltransferase
MQMKIGWFLNGFLARLRAAYTKLQVRLIMGIDDTLRIATGTAVRPMKTGWRGAVKVAALRPSSILDVGSGAGTHSYFFRNCGISARTLDFGTSKYASDQMNEIDYVGNFYDLQIDKRFECVWACHVLEHQPNSGEFLGRCRELLTDDGFIAVTVPPAKQIIVGGHLSIWNEGLLLYNLVRAGFDCSEAIVLRYGYNITVIAKRACDVPRSASFDAGDLRDLRGRFPRTLVWIGPDAFVGGRFL